MYIYIDAATQWVYIYTNIATLLAICREVTIRYVRVICTVAAAQWVYIYTDFATLLAICGSYLLDMSRVICTDAATEWEQEIIKLPRNCVARGERTHEYQRMQTSTWDWVWLERIW